MERYYNTIKAELIYPYKFRTDKDLEDAALGNLGSSVTKMLDHYI